MTRWSDYEKASEVRENDELLINSGWVVKRFDVAVFKWEKGEKWETGAEGPRWPQGEKWEKLLYSDLTSEEKLELKWERWEQWIQWVPGPEGPKWPQGERGPEGPRGVPGERWEAWPKWEKGEKWEKWETGPAGSGTGDLLSKNNLSDLADKVLSRVNLEVYSKAEVDGKIPTLPDLSPFLQKTEFQNEKNILQNNFNKKFSDLPNFWTFVLKEAWKWLSSNDFTNEDKNNLSQIAQGLPSFASRIWTLEKNFWTQKNLIDTIPETYVNKSDFARLDNKFLKKSDFDSRISNFSTWFKLIFDSGNLTWYNGYWSQSYTVIHNLGLKKEDFLAWKYDIYIALNHNYNWFNLKRLFWWSWQTNIRWDDNFQDTNNVEFFINSNKIRFYLNFVNDYTIKRLLIFKLY